MFALAGLPRAKLFTALREMGAAGLKGADLQMQWSAENPTRGYCYVVSEMVFWHLAPPKTTAWCLSVPGDNFLHRYLKWPDGSRVDLTAEQFEQPPDYSAETRRAFMPGGPHNSGGPSK